MELSRSKYLIDRRTGTVLRPDQLGADPGEPVEISDPLHEGRPRRDRSKPPEYPWMQKASKLLGLHGAIAVLHETQRKFTGRNVSDGKLIWENEFPKNRSLTRESALAGRDLYVLQSDGAVFGIDAETGVQRFEWTVPDVESMGFSQSFTQWGTYRADSEGLFLQSLNNGKSQLFLIPPDGKPRYSAGCDLSIMGAAYAGDLAVFSIYGEPGGLWAFNRVQGRIAWVHHLAHDRVDSFCYDGDKIYLFYGPNISCHEPLRGIVHWTAAVPAPNAFRDRKLSESETEHYYTRFENVAFHQKLIVVEFVELKHVSDSRYVR